MSNVEATLKALAPVRDEPMAYQVVGGVNAHQAYDGYPGREAVRAEGH